MSFPNRPVDAIESWHAHIYYDPAKTKGVAAIIRQQIENEFPDAKVGRWHDEAVGPHLNAMYQVAFETHQFDNLVQWLSVNRHGLDVLVHPQTENAWNDHLIFGFWLGNKLPLNEERLRETAARAERN